MAEYQFYEFRTVNRALTRAEQAEVNTKPGTKRPFAPPFWTDLFGWFCPKKEAQKVDE